MDSLQFRKKQFKYLAYLLQFNEDTLKEVIENIDRFYYSYQEKKCDKITGKPKTYRDGTVKKRTITPSTSQLKMIQSSIKKRILDPIFVPVHIQGAVKERSNISNGKFHQGNKYRFVTDLQDFFPSISNHRVYTFYLSLGHSSHVASWLTKLTTYEGKLPQGASTSPALANFCFLSVDNIIIAFCKNVGIKYTRFVDDLTFSAPSDFRVKTNAILKIITDNGFRISYRKTDYGDTQTVTGIKVNNNYIDVPDNIKEKARLVLDHNGYVHYMNNVRNTNKNIIKKL